MTIELEEEWLEKLIYWYQWSRQFITKLAAKAEEHLKLYEETSDPAHLQAAELFLERLADEKAHQPGRLAEIREQRKKVQWQRSRVTKS